MYFIHTYKFIHTYIQIHIHIHTYIHIYIYTYIHVYIYIIYVFEYRDRPPHRCSDKHADIRTLVGIDRSGCGLQVDAKIDKYAYITRGEGLLCRTLQVRTGALG